MFRITDESSHYPRYVGRTKALVIDNRDPLLRGRIRIRHPQVGDTGWIDYLKSPFEFNPPAIGDLVYVEADSGYISHLIAHGNLIKGPNSAPNLPETFQRIVPTNRGIYTPGGQFVELDDGIATPTNDPTVSNQTTQNKGIRITSSANNQIHIVEDSNSNQQFILIQDAGGNYLKLDYHNNELTINAIGSLITNVGTNQTETISGNLIINVTGSATINAENIILNSPNNSSSQIIPGMNGLITNSVANQDPLTGIPLTPVGGITTGS